MKCDFFRVSFSVVNRLPFTLNTPHIRGGSEQMQMIYIIIR